MERTTDHGLFGIRLNLQNPRSYFQEEHVRYAADGETFN